MKWTIAKCKTLLLVILLVLTMTYTEACGNKNSESESDLNEDTVDFLRGKLSYMGLTPKEYNEFIVYWLPRMEKNKYNLIYFPEKEYSEQAKLTISPKPDSIIRVFMVFKPLKEKIEIEEQILQSNEREGFTVVEWGGTELH